MDGTHQVTPGDRAMRCPNCGIDVPEQEWNCPACRMNVYWASQHYEALAQIRSRQGLGGDAGTPEFLRQAHRSAMSERPDARVMHKVRQVARSVMAGHLRRQDGAGMSGGNAVEDRAANVPGANGVS